MAIPTFYHPSLNKLDHSVTLSRNEAAHALKSRRLNHASPVRLINGAGLQAQGKLELSSKRAVTVNVETIHEAEKPRSISIVTALPKGDRQRTMIDMLTQLGVSRILPLQSERGITKYRSTMQEKWQRWAIEACKQSQNVWLPEICEAVQLDQLPFTQEIVLVAEHGGRALHHVQRQLLESSAGIVVLIGPEGGFSKRELALLNTNHYVPINLSKHILRTELAGISALSQLRCLTNGV